MLNAKQKPDIRLFRYRIDAKKTKWLDVQLEQRK